MTMTVEAASKIAVKGDSALLKSAGEVSGEEQQAVQIRPQTKSQNNFGSGE